MNRRKLLTVINDTLYFFLYNQSIAQETILVKKSQSVKSKSKLTRAITLYVIHFVLLKNFNLFFSVLWQGNNYTKMTLKQRKEIYPITKWTHNIIL